MLLCTSGALVCIYIVYLYLLTAMGENGYHEMVKSQDVKALMKDQKKWRTSIMCKVMLLCFTTAILSASITYFITAYSFNGNIEL